VEIVNDSNEESHRSDDQKLQESTLTGSRILVSRFENNPKDQLINFSPTSPPSSASSSSSISATSRINRSQSQESSNKPLTISNSLPINGINSLTSLNLKKESNDTIHLKQYEETKKTIDQLNQKVERLERDITERDQIIEKLVCYTFFK
jgi:thymidylate synthase